MTEGLKETIEQVLDGTLGANTSELGLMDSGRKAEAVADAVEARFVVTVRGDGKALRRERTARELGWSGYANQHHDHPIRASVDRILALEDQS